MRGPQHQWLSEVLTILNVNGNCVANLSKYTLTPLTLLHEKPPSAHLRICTLFRHVPYEKAPTLREAALQRTLR